ncbi:MAG: hypothetical protein JJU21_10500 [Salinarimonas sp.]|nr:hypothetical protein [Salinarimonas sp.]
MEDNASDLLRRLQVVLSRIDLDCACRATFEDAITRFSGLEQRRLARRHLHEAREYKQRIAALIDLLGEIDQLSEGEPDRSVFGETALIFDEIAASAHKAGQTIRRLDTFKGE